MRSFQTPLLLLLLVGCAPSEDELDIEFRPAPSCPQCTIKKAQFEIPPASQLGENVEIGSSTLIHTVNFTHDCVDQQPTCVETAREDLGVLAPGGHEEELLFATDWRLGDTEDAEVDVKLLRSGSVVGHHFIEARIVDD